MVKQKYFLCTSIKSIQISSYSKSHKKNHFTHHEKTFSEQNPPTTIFNTKFLHIQNPTKKNPLKHLKKKINRQKSVLRSNLRYFTKQIHNSQKKNQTSNNKPIITKTHLARHILRELGIDLVDGQLLEAEMHHDEVDVSDALSCPRTKGPHAGRPHLSNAPAGPRGGALACGGAGRGAGTAPRTADRFWLGLRDADESSPL